MMYALILALEFFLAAPAADDANALAVKLTTEGTANFEKKDSKTLSESYTEDATVTLVSKDKDSGGQKNEVKRGRGEVQGFYDTVFKDAGTVHAKNTVEHAKRITDDLLLITGVFETDVPAENLKLAFVQVRVRQNDKWLISNLQLFLLESN